MSKRDQILQAALELFIASGFEKTPTSQISKAAGVATGTLFHHFKTKEELINALYLEIKMALTQVLGGDHDTDAALQEQFRQLVESFASWALANPSRYRFLKQFNDSALITDSTRETAEKALESFIKLFDQGAEQGVFLDLPLELLHSLSADHLHSACEYLLEHPELWQQQAFREQYFKSFWAVLTG